MGEEQQVAREFIERVIEEFRRLGRTEFLNTYGFGNAREYFIHMPDSDEWFDSKAIIGAAYDVQFSDRGPLRADSFSGGEATVAARLREIGFNVVETGEDSTAEDVRLLVCSSFASARSQIPLTGLIARTG